jgi:hypothetical protein
LMRSFINWCSILIALGLTLILSPVVLADPEISWNTFLGSGSDDYGCSVAADDNGNLYVTGYTDTGWGSPINAHSGGTDAFVAKLDSNGVLQWHTFLGSDSDDRGRSVSVDGSGNVYVTGHSLGNWGSPINAHGGIGADAFVAKLDGNGALLWNTFLGSNGFDDESKSIFTDAGGSIYVTGFSFWSWGSPIRDFSFGSDDAFVAKLDSSGVLQWHTFLGSSKSDWGYSVAADDSGNVYVAGYGSADWGSPINAHAGFDDAFVAKLDSGGVLQWNTFLGGGDVDEGYSVVVDGSGNLYVTGYSFDSWGAPIRTFAGLRDAFVVKLDNRGVLQWSTFLGGGGYDEGRSVIADSIGNIYVSGFGGPSWGSPINPPSGWPDVFVAKLDGSGAIQWHTFLGNNNMDFVFYVAADIVEGSGNLYITGHGDADWGSPINAYSGNQDTFVAKIHDLDIDDDGWPNDSDGCPYDLYKNVPGICGCGASDTDTDGDETADCIDTDDDNDGIDDEIEMAGPGNGDGNADGIADSLQSHVTTLEVMDGEQYCTLALPDGISFTQSQAVDTPPADSGPDGVSFDYGYFDFTTGDIGMGQSTTVTLYLPAGASPVTYYKYGKTPDNPTDHWYEFLYDGQTGAEINGNIVTLHFVDGQRGDDILTPDGLIVDAGGPGFEDTASTATSGSGGGGCFITSLLL